MRCYAWTGVRTWAPIGAPVPTPNNISAEMALSADVGRCGPLCRRLEKHARDFPGLVTKEHRFGRSANGVPGLPQLAQSATRTTLAGKLGPRGRKLDQDERRTTRGDDLDSPVRGEHRIWQVTFRDFAGRDVDVPRSVHARRMSAVGADIDLILCDRDTHRGAPIAVF